MQFEYKCANLLIDASDLNDSLEQLVDALNRLLENISNNTFIAFVEEPGETQLFLEKRNANELYIEARRFDCMTNDPDGKHDVYFTAQVPFLKFAKKVRDAMNKIYNALGQTEYKRKWGHEFPLQKYLRLKELINDK